VFPELIHYQTSPIGIAGVGARAEGRQGLGSAEKGPVRDADETHPCPIAGCHLLRAAALRGPRLRDSLPRSA
jgi:hypothetical protein